MTQPLSISNIPAKLPGTSIKSRAKHSPLGMIPQKIPYPAKLPILEKKVQIIEALRKNPVVIITGETGSGKTTQIPKMCLEAGRGRTGMIGCTQPRRVAAIAVAQRIADELGEPLGRSVGYKIRFDDQSRRQPRIKIMTDGILLRETQSDPGLSAYDTLIIDEAHERSLNIDFLLGIGKDLLSKRRDLQLIITSATIDCEKFSRAFDNAPIIEVSGRTYPVEVLYLPPEQDQNGFSELSDPEAAVAAVEMLDRGNETGDILIFMPTERDIRETCEILRGKYDRAVILPLFARLPWREQSRIFQDYEAQKIIVATNIAETSLTIPGIRYVIDPGTARISQYNPRTRTNSLPVKEISRSSADQRKGRCGRVAAGLCIRLYSEEDYGNRPPFTAPEIMRSNLAGVILKMLSLHLPDIASFPFLDRPPGRSIQDGLETLRELGALEREGAEGAAGVLTDKGRFMARIPLDPRLGRMLIEARKEGCLEEIIILAAALSMQDPRERPADKEEEADKMHGLFQDPASDFMTLLHIWKGFQQVVLGKSSRSKLKGYCRRHFLSYKRMCEWQDVVEQIKEILREERFLKAAAETQKNYQDFYAAIHRSILSGYLSNIAVKREKNTYLATKGREIMLFPGSVLFNKGGTWIVAAEILETSRTFARMCATIDSAWLEALGGPLCRHSYSEPHWEKNRGEVVAWEQVSLFGLVIVPRRSVSYGPIAPEEAAQIFIRQALLEGEIKFPFAFLGHNQALRETIAALEDRLRRPDLLVTDEVLAQFYEQRLPGVYNIRTLQRMIKDRGTDSFLRMEESELLAGQPDPEELALYPEEIELGGARFPLVYQFLPGAGDDGSTVQVPVHLLPLLKPEDTEWLIPGLLREKITSLLKGLPKEYRKKLLPLSATCAVICREMPVRQGHFLSCLADFIYKRYGLEIPAAAWPLASLPEHLRLRFSVIDREDKEIAAGRDLALLQSDAVIQARGTALDDLRKIWEKDGISTWDFGDLPEYLELADRPGQVGRAYPALVARDEQLALRLFLDHEEALRQHGKGVAGLFALHFAEERKHLKKNLALDEEMRAWTKYAGGPKSLERALVNLVWQNLFAINIRTSETFQTHAAQARSRILPAGQEMLRAVLPLLKAYHEAASRLQTLEEAHRFNRPARQFLGDLQKALDRLGGPAFLERYGPERLVHFPRYLRGLTLGAERGLLHLEKALAKVSEISSLADELQALADNLTPGSSREKRTALEECFWMIEEYRVSLFAQELKTPFPISRKKITSKLGEIKRLF